MANTLTYLDSHRSVGNRIIKRYKVVLSGSYTQSSGIGTAGETLDFATAGNPGFNSRTRLPGPMNGSTAAMLKAQDFEIPPVYGFTFQVEQAASTPTTANYVLRIFTSDGTELTSGTYASGAAALVAAGAQPIIVKAIVPSKYD